MDSINKSNNAKYQHYLCEIIIRYLYGEHVDVTQYKIKYNPADDEGWIKGVDVTKFDYTTEKNVAKNEVYYDGRLTRALKLAKFGEKYGDLHMHDEGESLFKAIIESRAYKCFNSDKSILKIYPK